MITHELQQGTPEWLAYRTTMFNASDAPAMLGKSPYKTRTELLHELHTGLSPDVDAATQRRFDVGHAAEAAARPMAEREIGEGLYPVVGSLEIEGLPLSASFDGLTMAENIVWEHKLMNVNLAESLADGIIPDSYHPQLEQQLMVSGAEKALFMATSLDRTAMECVWYYSNPELRSAILQGWAQFVADLKAYAPTETVIKPAGSAVTALPAVSVQVSGAIAIQDNLPAFEVALRDFIENRLIHNPKTDQDFADLELQIKALKNAESALDAVEVQMLAQVESVDLVKRTKDMLHKLTRDNRLMAEKLLAAKKDTIRAEAVLDGRNALADHIAALNQRIGVAYMPQVAHDFAGVIKGKRSIDSMQDAIATELARTKIAANELADKITLNLRAINDQADFGFLFSDVATLVLKDPELVSVGIKYRIAEHQTKESARMEAERTRIAEQERIKAQAIERARADAEIAAATAKARAEAHTQAQADAQAKRASDEAIEKAKVEQVNPAPLSEDIKAMATGKKPYFVYPPESPICEIVQTDNSDLWAQEERIRAAQADTSATLRLGEICERLEFNVTANFLASLGYQPVATDKRALLFKASEFGQICESLVRHIQSVSQGVAA